MKAPFSCQYINEQFIALVCIVVGGISLNKKLMIFPIMVAMSFSLVGCGTNDESAEQDQNRNGMQPVGYYSNENHEGNRGGNATILDGTDNDGPITEMMDHSFGLEGENVRNESSNRQVRTSPNGIDTTNVSDTGNRTEGNQLFSRDDYNYHGHLGQNTRKVESQYYYEAYEGHLVEKINNAVAKVKNVNDVQTVIHGNNALIAVKLANGNRENATIAAIQRTVQPLLNGKTSKILTDASSFSRLRNLDNNLRDWSPKDQIYLDMDNLFRTNNGK